jgi:hypothetical protein
MHIPEELEDDGDDEWSFNISDEDVEDSDEHELDASSFVFSENENEPVFEPTVEEDNVEDEVNGLEHGSWEVELEQEEIDWDEVEGARSHDSASPCPPRNSSSSSFQESNSPFPGRYLPSEPLPRIVLIADDREQSSSEDEEDSTSSMRSVSHSPPPPQWRVGSALEMDDHGRDLRPTDTDSAGDVERTNSRSFNRPKVISNARTNPRNATRTRERRISNGLDRVDEEASLASGSLPPVGATSLAT